MGDLGLVLRPVAAESVRQARPETQVQLEAQVSVARWQPDWVLISSAAKKITVLDLCRPSDIHKEQLIVAISRKQWSYRPLKEALGHYSELGWTIGIFPWVVGIRGLIDIKPIQAALAFLEIPREYWKEGLEQSVLASVRAFSFLHRIRFGGRIDGEEHGTDGDDSNCSSDVSKDEDDVYDPGPRKGIRDTDSSNDNENDQSVAESYMASFPAP